MLSSLLSHQILSFVLMRYLGIKGDRSIYGNIYEFFTLTKYPSSLYFTMLFLGINFSLLGLFFKFKLTRVKTFFSTYGKVPLFFYLSHLYVLLYLSEQIKKSDYIFGYVLWILLISLYYYPCKGYGMLKKRYKWMKFL